MEKEKKKIELADSELLKQFYLTLNSIFLSTEKTRLDTSSDISKKVKELLSVDPSDQSWDQAYFIEQLMVSFYDETGFKIELKRRLIEAQINLSPELYKHYKKEFENEKGHLTGKQTLLRRLINDLQWRYSVRQAHRVYSNRTREKTITVFIAAIVLFFVPNLCILIASHISPLLPGFLFGWRPYHILTALFAGLLGASFSILAGLKAQLLNSDLDTLKVIHKYQFIFSRAVIGMGAALIFFYFFQSGLIKNEALFPKFDYSNSIPQVLKDIEQTVEKHLAFNENSDQTQLKNDIKLLIETIVKNNLNSPEKKEALNSKIDTFVNGVGKIKSGDNDLFMSDLKALIEKIQPAEDYTMYALLIVWCFIAGFSEKLVLNLLSKTEAQFNSQK